MQGRSQISAIAYGKINCIQCEKLCPKLGRTPCYATPRLRDRASSAERLHRRLTLRRRVTPKARVRLDRIGGVPLRELFLVEREISLVAQRLDVLQIEAESDLMVDIEIA